VQTPCVHPPDRPQPSSVRDQSPQSLVQAIRSQYNTPRPEFTPAPHFLQAWGLFPRLVDQIRPLPDPEGTRLTSPIPGKCLVCSKA
jgi:hypothetical protein